MCELSHIAENDLIKWSDKTQMLALVQAMAYVENGVIISTGGSMTEGYEMAKKRFAV